jgi:dihydroorotate dehydrogenase (NAD+) catalytic subunit
MTIPLDLPRYDPTRSYDWNYEQAPEPPSVDVPPVSGEWNFCGLRVASPLGIAAGPLLNGRWVRYYAALGFDVLTYKTVRSRERACYPLPNLVPVAVERMHGGEASVPAATTPSPSWAVSFGMPSKSPNVWRADVEATRRLLPREKILVVSVVATEQPGWTIDDLADDYARCARWAIESGADAVETNFSCPNVCTSDGQLYQLPRAAALCAARVRSAIGDRPYIVKVGHLRSADEADALVEALGPYADALAMTNSVAAPVVGADGERLFGGQPRGICGAAILDPSIAQTRLVQQLVTRRRLQLMLPPEERRAMPVSSTADRGPGTWRPPQLIGVGGAFTADDVRRYLVAGAESIHLATAAMLDPTVGLKILAAWNG